MKKSLFYSLFYIGCALLFFNSAQAKPVENFQAGLEEIYQAFDKYNGEVLYNEKGKQIPLVKSSNELVRLYIAYKLVDRAYKDGKIKEDVTPLLKKIYPTTKDETLYMVGDWMRVLISLQRRYNYFVDTLEKDVHGLEIFPDDAPIIAADGEYAVKDPKLTPQTDSDSYKVDYVPYKYLEYDGGDLGDPVRRRDKNFIESPKNIKEITLALLKFDLPAFFKAISKNRNFADGSDEKTVELANGFKARILSATAGLGDEAEIKTVIEVYIPKGYYINGDYLNQHNQPHFFLSEDVKEGNNIKNYQLSYPAAAGVVNNGKTKRLYTGIVRFPLKIERADLTSDVIIRGYFRFNACNANADCQEMISDHYLKLPVSDISKTSVYDNYVTQSFARIPQEQTPHASLNNAVYENNKFVLTFDTNKSFSNVAAMVEDADGSDFLTPQYTIDKDKVTVSFDPPKKITDKEVAVTATFDNKETLRTVVTPAIEERTTAKEASADYKAFYLLGLCLNLMPLGLYIFFQLVFLGRCKKNRLKVLCNYALGSAVALCCISLLFNFDNGHAIFENSWMTTAALIVAGTLLAESNGDTDLRLFRPFKQIFKFGMLFGVMIVLCMTALPMYKEVATFSSLHALSGTEYILSFIVLWCGIITLPAIALLSPKFVEPNKKILYFNVAYNIVFIFGSLFLLFRQRGNSAVIIGVTVIFLTMFLWRMYPHLLTRKLNRLRSQEKKKRLFLKLQYMMFGWLSTIYIIGAGSLAYTGLKSNSGISPEAVQNRLSQASYQKPLLVAVEGYWTFSSFANTFTLDELKKKGLEVETITSYGHNPSAEQWLDLYNKQSAPLNILFTERHPQGLVLPSDLRSVHWEEALKTFE